MATRTGLIDALFTKTQQRILGLLFGQPRTWFSTSEIIRRSRAGSGATQRQLRRLKDSGLIRSMRVQNQVHYFANPASPIFHELVGIIAKTVGLADPLRAALSVFDSRIVAAFVFGSVAKGSDRASSDIDLLVISDDLTYAELFGALDRASAAVGRTVNPTVYTSRDFARKSLEGSAFLSRIAAAPKIWVIGSENDLPH